MICHQCHQNSIKINMVEEEIHIICEICGLDISCGRNPLLCDLFIYNENLEAAEKLGKEALIEGLDIKDNPYSINSSQIILNKRWELGYSREQESYEYNALSFSAKKIEEKLKEELKDKDRHIEELCNEITEQNVKIGNYIQLSKGKRGDFYAKLLRIKILGRFLRKYIVEFEEDYRDITNNL